MNQSKVDNFPSDRVKMDLIYNADLSADCGRKTAKARETYVDFQRIVDVRSPTFPYLLHSKSPFCRMFVTLRFYIFFYLFLPLLFSSRALAHGESCRFLFQLRDPLEARLFENGFETRRGVDLYSRKFLARDIPPFLDFVRNIPRGGIYFDAGTGQAITLRELLQRREELGIEDIEFVGAAYKKPESLELEIDRLRFSDTFDYIDGGHIERLIKDPSSKMYSYRGKVDFLTEVLGPSVYTDNIPAVFNAYADLLKVGGQALIYFHEQLTFFYVTRNNKKYRLTLREMQSLIPVMTGGRLRVRAARMRLKEGWPQFEETVLWLERVDAKELGFDPFNLAEPIKDDHPPVRKYNVHAMESYSWDFYSIRQQDMQREEVDFKKAYVPYFFILPRR